MVGSQVEVTTEIRSYYLPSSFYGHQPLEFFTFIPLGAGLQLGKRKVFVKEWEHLGVKVSVSWGRGVVGKK